MLRRFLFFAVLAVSLGLASTAGAATPMLALGTSSSSGGTTCVLTQSGKVYCWGDNSNGALGSNAADDGNGVAARQLVPLPGPAVQVAAGDVHFCALLEDASVYCWGANYYGQLGNATNTSSFTPNPTPAKVALPSPVSQIAAGSMQTCFIYVSGSASCVGDNSFGQFGYSPTAAINTTPKPIALGSATAKKIAIGGNFACVLLTTLSAKCMGFNPSGQLGSTAGLHSSTSTPSTVGLGGPALDIEAGSSHACAMLQNLTTWCWGFNGIGQLGIGTADNSDHYDPAKVSIGNAQQIALGTTHTCVRLAAGGIDCWGNNLTGELGVDDNILTFNANPTPLLSALDPNAGFLAAGGPFTCTIATSGSVQCAGDNSSSELGVPKADLAYSFIPITVPGLNVYDAAAPISSQLLPLAPSKPKLKFKKSGRKIKATARVTVSGVGAALPSADCTGSATTRFERKVVKGKGAKRKTTYLKVVAGTAKLSVKKGRCGFGVSLKLARKYGGKTLYLRLKLKDGTHTKGFDKRFKSRIKRV